MRTQREPSPRYDFRALAADRPVQLQLPTEPVNAPLIIESRTDTHGRPYARVSGIGEQAYCHALDLRRWADQLNEAADKLEGKTLRTSETKVQPVSVNSVVCFSN